jgi:hypothetical protein
MLLAILGEGKGARVGRPLPVVLGIRRGGGRRIKIANSG